jgi:hypothetical protein
MIPFHHLWIHQTHATMKSRKLANNNKGGKKNREYHFGDPGTFSISSLGMVKRWYYWVWLHICGLWVAFFLCSSIIALFHGCFFAICCDGKAATKRHTSDTRGKVQQCQREPKTRRKAQAPSDLRGVEVINKFAIAFPALSKVCPAHARFTTSKTKISPAQRATKVVATTFFLDWGTALWARL